MGPQAPPSPPQRAAVEEGIRGARGHQQPDAKPPAPADGAPAPAADAEDKKPKVADMKMPNIRSE